MINFKNALPLVALLSTLGCVEVQPRNEVVSAPNLSIKDGYYSLELNWESQNISQVTGVVIYRGDSKTSLKEYATLPNTSKYLDTLVGVRKELYYTVAYQLSNGKLSAFSDTLSKLPKEPINTSTSNGGEIGGIHHAWWKFQSSSFKTLTNVFTIHDEPSNQGRLFYTMYQGEINNIGFYFGIQTHVTPNNPNEIAKKGIIFSRWKTQDANNYALAPGGWGHVGKYPQEEDGFIGVRKNYEWTPGTYKTVLKQDSTVKDTRNVYKDWYSVTIQRLPNGEKIWIGSIAFDQSSSTVPGSNGIKNEGVNWTEIYFNPEGVMPTWHVSMDEVLADGKRPIQAKLLYDDTKFTTTSNTFTRLNQVHFIMGPKVKRFHRPRTISFTK